MFSNRCARIILYILMCLVFLYTVNEDIFSYYDAYFLNRDFSPTIDAKGDYLLSPQLVLKKGIYWIVFYVNTNATGNGYFIKNDTEIIVRDEFLPEVYFEQIKLEIKNPSEQIYLGISYDPAGGNLDVGEVFISSDFVITKDSVLRHFVVTLFLIILFYILGWRIFFSSSWFKCFGQASSPANERIFIFLLAISAITSFPFFYNKIFLAPDDYMFHLLRIEGIKVGLENGIFPIRVNPYFLNGYGYGDGLFYPNLTLYFSAILRVLGFHPITVFKIFVIVLNFLSIVCFYFVTMKISQSRYSGLIGAVFYAFASYRLIDILFRTGFGEAQSFLFTPLIILGLYNIFNGRTER